MRKRNVITLTTLLAALAVLLTIGSWAMPGIFTGATVTANNAIPGDSCQGLPDHDQLASALSTARNTTNGGFDLDMWGTMVNRDGVVCAVAFTGGNRGDQWPGSRFISAQKANAANAFSLPGLALSTTNLYSAVQPGGSLFGLQESNPIDTQVAYRGNSQNYGQHNDPMVGRKIGGANVFGGGLALYYLDEEDNPVLVGAIGVSGDSSCADHNIAWRTRDGLNLDNVPGGINPVSGDNNIVYDATVGPDTGHTTSPSGWGHPECSETATTIGNALPENFPLGPGP